MSLHKTPGNLLTLCDVEKGKAPHMRDVTIYGNVCLDWYRACLYNVSPWSCGNVLLYTNLILLGPDSPSLYTVFVPKITTFELSINIFAEAYRE